MAIKIPQVRCFTAVDFGLEVVLAQQKRHQEYGNLY
jgi:hypothetical protein